MGGQVFRLGHQFNHSLTKKRFEMMRKMKAKKQGLIKYIFLVPFVLAFMLVATANAQGPKTITGKVYLESTELPATGAAVIVAGTTQGTVVDMDGEFKIDVDGNPELVFSFVGYETERLKAKTAASKPVMLHPKAYTYAYDDAKSEKAGKVSDAKPSSDVSEILKEDEESPEVFYIVEEMPSYPGGKAAMRDYIMENLEYPEKAKKKNISGKVVVQFIVTSKGSLKNIEIAQSTNEMLNDAAMDVFMDMPLWNPGKQRGKPLNVKVLVPVTFVADKE
jgi:TonB family protein